MNTNNIASLLKGKTLSFSAIAEGTDSLTKAQKKELNETLESLIFSGIIGKEDDSYFLLSDRKIFLGRVISKNRNFVIVKDVRLNDEVKVSGKESDALLVGDLVYVARFSHELYHCLSYLKPVTSFKGYFSLNQDGEECLLVDYLNRCGKQVLITRKKEGIELRQGDLVRADIVSYKRDVFQVKAMEVLVRADSVNSDISDIIVMHDAKLEFPKEVLEEAKKMPQFVLEDEKKDRVDFTSEVVVTIDGDDAHDFDDALQIKRLLKGYRVVVHIADVTHYVKPHHPLDDEALERGTSIYVADRVVPMLPFELSNGICSLNPDVERLVLSVTMDIDSFGNVFYSKIERGVIRSKGRLTYKKVNEFFETGESDYSEEIQDTLNILHECASKIRKRRTRQGALKLDTTELKFSLDETGEPISVEREEQGEAERMVEDFMVIANCEVAKALKEHHIPVLYRIHEFPPKEKITSLRAFLKKLNLNRSFPRYEDITAARLNDFLDAIKDEGDRKAVSFMLLRSLAKARYAPLEKGHFGLAELDYCHFTSPIRRYPDDIIHRLVKDYLLDEKEFSYEEVFNKLENLGMLTSMSESRGETIEREVDDLEACKYMSHHIGETFKGRISSIISKGIFVETDIGIDGFLSFHHMKGYFIFDEESFSVIERDSNVVYTLGSPLEVVVFSCNREKSEIDFATPEYYKENVFSISDEEKKTLAKEGFNVYTKNDHYNNHLSSHIRFSKARNDKTQKKGSKSKSNYQNKKNRNSYKGGSKNNSYKNNYHRDDKKRYTSGKRKSRDK